MAQKRRGPNQGQVAAAIERFEGITFDPEDNASDLQAAMAKRWRSAGCYTIGVAGVKVQTGVVLEDGDWTGLAWLERRSGNDNPKWVNGRVLAVNKAVGSAYLLTLAERDGGADRRAVYRSMRPNPSSIGRLIDALEAGKGLDGRVNWDRIDDNGPAHDCLQHLLESGVVSKALTGMYLQPEAIQRHSPVMYPMAEGIPGAEQ